MSAKGAENQRDHYRHESERLAAENTRLRMALALLVACDDDLQVLCTGENGCPLEAHHHAIDTAKAALKAGGSNG